MREPQYPRPPIKTCFGGVDDDDGTPLGFASRAEASNRSGVILPRGSGGGAE